MLIVGRTRVLMSHLPMFHSAHGLPGAVIMEGAIFCGHFEHGGIAIPSDQVEAGSSACCAPAAGFEGPALTELSHLMLAARQSPSWRT